MTLEKDRPEHWTIGSNDVAMAADRPVRGQGRLVPAWRTFPDPARSSSDVHGRLKSTVRQMHRLWSDGSIPSPTHECGEV